MDCGELTGDQKLTTETASFLETYSKAPAEEEPPKEEEEDEKEN